MDLQDEFYMRELVTYARSFLGKPYLWGGDGPTGYDCSGLIIRILRKYCLVGPFEDLSAQGLYDKLREEGVVVRPKGRAFPTGTILFYGQSLLKIEHVALALDFYSVLEAGGGNHRTDSVEKANKLNACVREYSVHFRDDLLVGIMPAYPWQIDSEEDEVRQ